MCRRPSRVHLPFVWVISLIFVTIFRGSSLLFLLPFRTIASSIVFTHLLAFMRAPKRSLMMTCPICWMAACLSTKNRGSSARQKVSTLSPWRQQLLEGFREIPCLEQLLFVLQICRTSCSETKLVQITFSGIWTHHVFFVNTYDASVQGNVLIFPFVWFPFSRFVQLRDKFSRRIKSDATIKRLLSSDLVNS